MNRAVTAALAVFFSAVGFYTSLGPLSTFASDYLFSANLATAIALLAAIVISAIVLAIALARAFVPPPAGVAAVLLCWLGPLGLSTALGFDPLAGLQLCAIGALGAAFYFAAIRFARPGRIRVILRSFLATGTAAILAGIVMNVARRPLDLWVFNHGRASGPFATANYFGAFLVTFSLTAIGAAVAWRGRDRAGALIATVAAAVALVLTYSRSAQIGVLAGLIALTWWLGRRRGSVALGGVLVVAALLAFTRPDVHHDPSENFGRWSIWRTGIAVAQLFAFSGAGPMGYHLIYPAVAPVRADPAAAQGYAQPHNVLISLLADLGVAGALCIGLGWLLFARQARAAIERADRPAQILAYALCAGLVGTFAQGMFDLAGVPELLFVWIPFAGLTLAVVSPPASAGASRPLRFAHLAALPLVGCGVTGPRHPAPSLTPPAIVVHSAGSSLKAVHFSLTRDGRRVYTIVADANVSRQIGEGGGQSDFVNPHVKFYDPKGTTLFADSPAASVFERERTIVMTGGVQAYTSTGIRLACRTLTFDDRTQRLHGEGDVVLATPRGERLTGDRVEADTRLSQVHISAGPLR